jgi:hypothetical protein
LLARRDPGEERPRFAVWGGWMNLQVQVEPLC